MENRKILQLGFTYEQWKNIGKNSKKYENTMKYNEFIGFIQNVNRK